MWTYNTIQNKLEHQQDKLITRYFLGRDLFTAAQKADKHERQNLVPDSDILILHTMQHTLTYYLHKSTIQNSSRRTKYALYRDDSIHQAQAIVENIKALRVQILPLAFNRQSVKIIIAFDNNDILEITCTLPP